MGCLISSIVRYFTQFCVHIPSAAGTVEEIYLGFLQRPTLIVSAMPLAKKAAKNDISKFFVFYRVDIVLIVV